MGVQLVLGVNDTQVKVLKEWNFKPNAACGIYPFGVTKQEGEGALLLPDNGAVLTAH
jgi:hypothetical protein